MAKYNEKAAPTLDDMLRESREKRKAEQLAQEIFGRRAKTPATAKSKPALGNSLASRVGVSKARYPHPRHHPDTATGLVQPQGTNSLQQRPSSLPRTNSAPARNARAAPPPHVNRPAPREGNQRNRQPFQQQEQRTSSDPIVETKSNGYSSYEEPATNGEGNSISIRGMAAGPHVVIASNFAPGTTAADIESVMLDVGGQMTECRLTSHDPVVAEMTFVEKGGAETVISTFNNKKADGRTLHVFWKGTGAGGKAAEVPVAPLEIVEESMEVDENAQSREAENRLREERRGRPDRDPRGGYPTGPRGGYEDDYYRGPRREPAYQDNRYGYGSRGGRWRDDGRLGYSRGGGGQGWRP